MTARVLPEEKARKRPRDSVISRGSSRAGSRSGLRWRCERAGVWQLRLAG